MEQPPPADDADAYAAWIARRAGEELRARREALRMSVYAVAKLAHVSDQTISNAERGANAPLVTTLARLCVRYGTTLTDFFRSVERGGPQ